MSSIWVIEHGEYSNYGVRGVYSSQENAELAVSNGITGSIAEWPLDPSVDHWKNGLTLMLVTMNRAGDSIVESHACGEEGCNGPWQMGKFHDRFGSQFIIEVMSWVRSEKEAVKIANEKRAQLIASGEWKL